MRPQVGITVTLVLLIAGMLSSLVASSPASQDRPPDIPPLVWEQATTHRGPPPQPQMLEPIGQIGGPARAVFVQGTLAYVGRGPRVVILDATDPAAPVELGATVPLSSYVNDIEVVGTTLYAAVQNSGFRVFDVADPSHPLEIGAFSSIGQSHAVAVVDSLAYFADGTTGLRVVDVTDPTQPVELGHAELPGSANAVAVQGDTAFIAGDWAGLRVIDVSDPTQPTEIGALDTGGNSGDVAVQEDLVFLADGVGLRVIDAADPMHPQEIGVLDAPGNVWGLATGEDRVYIANWWNGLMIVDVSTPAQPVTLGRLETPGWAIRIATSGGVAYVADGDGGLRVVDITDPTAPAELAAVESLGIAHELALSGTTAYVAGSFSGLWVFDMADPGQPEPLATAYTGGDVLSVDVAGTTAVALDASTGLHVFSMADPANPILLGSALVTHGALVRVDEAAQFALVMKRYSNLDLAVIDISDPSHPVLISTFATPGHAVDLILHDQKAFVADGHFGLSIVGLSDPANPILLGSEPGPLALAVALSGRFAYVASYPHTLDVIDVSDPTEPVWMGSSIDPDNFSPQSAVAASGATAYVLDLTGMLHVFDVSDPAWPAPMLTRSTGGRGNDIALAGDIAYVAAGHAGLSLFQPLRDKATAPISLDGGLLASSAGETFLLFPSGAFSEPVAVTYRHRLSDHAATAASAPPPLQTIGVGHTFSVDAVTPGTGQPAQLSPDQGFTTLIHYAGAELGSVIEESLKLHRWNGSRWVPEPTSVVYPAMNAIVANPEQLGLFALLGQTRQTYLPVTFRSGHLPFSMFLAVAPSEIQAGETATLAWSVQGARAAYLDGSRVALTGSRQVQPLHTTTYVLRAVKWDGSIQEDAATITIHGSPSTPTPTPTPRPTPQPTPLYSVGFAHDRSDALIDGTGCQTGNGCTVFQIQVANHGNRPSTYRLAKSEALPPGWSSFFCWGNVCEFGNSPRPRTIDVNDHHTVRLNFLLPSSVSNGQNGAVAVQGFCQECSPQEVYQQTFTIEIFIPPTPVHTPTPTPTPGAGVKSDGPSIRATRYPFPSCWKAKTARTSAFSPATGKPVIPRSPIPLQTRRQAIGWWKPLTPYRGLRSIRWRSPTPTCPLSPTWPTAGSWLPPAAPKDAGNLGRSTKWPGEATEVCPLCLSRYDRLACDNDREFCRLGTRTSLAFDGYVRPHIGFSDSTSVWLATPDTFGWRFQEVARSAEQSDSLEFGPLALDLWDRVAIAFYDGEQAHGLMLAASGRAVARIWLLLIYR